MYNDDKMEIIRDQIFEERCRTTLREWFYEIKSYEFLDEIPFDIDMEKILDLFLKECLSLGINPDTISGDNIESFIFKFKKFIKSIIEKEIHNYLRDYI